MENEFKHFMDAWNNSSIYLKLKAQLEKKKQELLEFKFTKEQYAMSINNIYTKEDVEKMVDLIFFNFNLPDSYKQEIDYLEEIRIRNTTKKELYFEFGKELVHWHYLLKVYIDLEDYELAAKIRDVIYIKNIEFKERLEKYCETFEEAEDDNFIHISVTEVRKIFGV